MIIDSHVHIFTSKIISNVSKKSGIMKELHLQINEAYDRCNMQSLEDECHKAGVDACLILPTETATKIKEINNQFRDIAAKRKPFLYSAATLHPDYHYNREELIQLKAFNINAIKLSSFSQGFALEESNTLRLFDLIENINIKEASHFFVILDTFYKADKYFGTPAKYTTTPKRFGKLVKNYPEINFVGAHMGGLAAPFDEIMAYLPPCKNLYLDTSNAAHTLKEAEFIDLLMLHGPEHILFGTDWPWFNHTQEIDLISKLLEDAGYTDRDKNRVFYRNAIDLLGNEKGFICHEQLVK